MEIFFKKIVLNFFLFLPCNFLNYFFVTNKKKKLSANIIKYMTSNSQLKNKFL